MPAGSSTMTESSSISCQGLLPASQEQSLYSRRPTILVVVLSRRVWLKPVSTQNSPVTSVLKIFPKLAVRLQSVGPEASNRSCPGRSRRPHRGARLSTGEQRQSHCLFTRHLPRLKSGDFSQVIRSAGRSRQDWRAFGQTFAFGWECVVPASGFPD